MWYARQDQAIDRQWQMRLQRGEYEAQLHQRRYEEDDPSIPKDIVCATTRRLRKAFAGTSESLGADLAVVAQQHYLYLETVEKPAQIVPGLIPARFGKRGGRRRTPMGRMVWVGEAERWGLELYKWSDGCWDEDNEAGTHGGTPEQCIVEATLGW